MSCLECCLVRVVHKTLYLWCKTVLIAVAHGMWQVSITDFDDSERTIDLTAALVEGVTGSVEVVLIF